MALISSARPRPPELGVYKDETTSSLNFNVKGFSEATAKQLEAIAPALGGGKLCHWSKLTVEDDAHSNTSINRLHLTASHKTTSLMRLMLLRTTTFPAAEQQWAIFHTATCCGASHNQLHHEGKPTGQKSSTAYCRACGVISFFPLGEKLGLWASNQVYDLAEPLLTLLEAQERATRPLELTLDVDLLLKDLQELWQWVEETNERMWDWP